MEQFVQHTQVNKAILQSRLAHPITGSKYPNRLVFNQLKKYVSHFFNEGFEPRMIGLAGLRGVGKTTLMWQIGSYVYNNITPKVFFFNVNAIQNIGSNLYDALEVFQSTVLKKRFSECNEPMLLLFDEVHDDANWANTLKILYDEARWCFIMATGSSALLLNNTADLARRMHIEKIFPFKFSEYVAAKTFTGRTTLFPPENLATDMRQSLFYSETAIDAFAQLQTQKKAISDYWENIRNISENNVNEWINNYINYQNIPAFVHFKDKNSINDSIIELFKRVIQ